MIAFATLKGDTTYRCVYINNKGANTRDKFQATKMQIYYFISGNNNKLSSNNLIIALHALNCFLTDSYQTKSSYKWLTLNMFTDT